MEQAERGLRRGGGRVGGVLDRHGSNKRRRRPWAHRRKHEVVSGCHGFRAVVAVAVREAGGGLRPEWSKLYCMTTCRACPVRRLGTGESELRVDFLQEGTVGLSMMLKRSVEGPFHVPKLVV